MKIKIGTGPLRTAFLNAWEDFKTINHISEKPQSIFLFFQKTHNIKFIDNRGLLAEDEILFPSHEDYLLFLLRHQ